MVCNYLIPSPQSAFIGLTIVNGNHLLVDLLWLDSYATSPVDLPGVGKVVLPDNLIGQKTTSTTLQVSLEIQ